MYTTIPEYQNINKNAFFYCIFLIFIVKRIKYRKFKIDTYANIEIKYIEEELQTN